MSDDGELAAIMVELERRALMAERQEPLDVRIARVREMLVAAFGEADFTAATSSTDGPSA